MPSQDDPFLSSLIDLQSSASSPESTDGTMNPLTPEVLLQMREALTIPDPELFSTKEGRGMLYNAWFLTQMKRKSIELGKLYPRLQYRQFFSAWMHDLLRTGRMDPLRPLPAYRDLAELWQITEDQVARVIWGLRRERLLPAKKRRQGFGEVMLTKRDWTVLRWIADQRAMRYDQIQRLLARESTWETKDPRRLSMTRTTQTIQRWVRAGLVVYRHLLVGEPGWIWLTAKGLRMLELHFRASAPAYSTLAHLYAINEVLLHLENEALSHKGELSWESERWLQHELEQMKQAGNRHRHQPDAIVILDGEEFELEVERSRKAQDYLEDLMRGAYGFSNGALRYYVAHEARTVVLAAFNKLTPYQIDRPWLEIYDLETFQPLSERKGMSTRH